MRYLLSPYRLPTHHQVYLNEDEMGAWLNAIICLWHPAILWGTDSPPRVDSAYEHEQPKAGRMYVLPETPPQFLPDDWDDRLHAIGAIRLPAHSTREATWSSFYEKITESAQKPETQEYFNKPEILQLLELPEEAVQPFYGLGFGYMMIDTLFEAMDHDKLLDLAGFWSDIQLGIQTLLDKAPAEETENHLKNAAQKLLSAREVLYSVNIHLLDLWDLTEQTAGCPPLALATGNPLSILCNAKTLEQLPADLLTTISSKMDEAIQPPILEVIGGIYRDREDGILPVESQLWNLRHGREVTKRLLKTNVEVLARKQSASHPQTPCYVQQTGFRRAFLSSFDGATTPSYRATIVNWTSPDGKSIDAFTRVPSSTAKAETFFNLVHTLHQSISQDSAPTVSIIHDRETVQPFYADWLALSKLGPVLGEWSTFTRYFSDAMAGEYVGVSNADDFFIDYLEQRVNARRADVVSGFARHARERRQLDAAYAFAAINRVMAAAPFEGDPAQQLAALHALENTRETAGVDGIIGQEYPEIAKNTTYWAKWLTSRLQSRSAENQPGYMVLNPCMFTRRVTLELDKANGHLPITDPLKAAQTDADQTRVVVEVPPLGFAWIPATGNPAPAKPRVRMADGHTIRNEFLEAEIDEATGGIKAIRDVKTRSSRIGMQLVFNPGSRSECRGVQITKNGAALGEITSTGVLFNEANEEIAEFKLRLRAWLTRPMIDVKIDITPKMKPTGYPWHSYYGARFAWRDERAAIVRGVNGAAMRTDHNRPMSADFVDIRLGRFGTTIVTGGLPFHQRQGSRMLDVILVPECEETASFELGLALDREYPMQAAFGFVSPVSVIPTTKGPPHVGPLGWLFQVDSPNLLLLGLRPTADGKRSMIATFLETSGVHGGTANLICVRDPISATMIDGDDQQANGLSINGDAVQLDFAAGELFRVRIDFE